MSNNINKVTVFGKLITEVEFRSGGPDNSDLYEFTILTKDKSVRGGRIRITGSSKLSVVVDKSHVKINADFDCLGKESVVKIEGQLIQDKVGGLGTVSIYAHEIEFYDIQESDVNYAQFEGQLRKEVMSKEINENTVRANLLLIQNLDENSSITIYTSMWNNLAKKVINMGLKVGDTVRIIGNPISRKYFDVKSNQNVELSEILCKRVDLVKSADVSE